MSGYKRTTTGQTTTYFNRELSDADKALLGDSTPKRISDTNEISPQSSMKLTSGAESAMHSCTSPESLGSSAWNSAGTWEEHDVTHWATLRLKELMMSIHYDGGKEEVHQCKA